MAAKDPDPAWLKGPTEGRLRDVFCFKYRRVVANDNTVRFGKLVLDLPASAMKYTYARARVQIHEGFDGTVSVHYQGGCLMRRHGGSQASGRAEFASLPHARPIIRGLLMWQRVYAGGPTNTVLQYRTGVTLSGERNTSKGPVFTVATMTFIGTPPSWTGPVYVFPLNYPRP